MAARKPLRAVAPDETAPAAPAPKTITQAADHGTDRELLVALRSRIATAVEDPKTPAAALAALSKRLEDIRRGIAAIDARDEEETSNGGSVPDETFDASAV